MGKRSTKRWYGNECAKVQGPLRLVIEIMVFLGILSVGYIWTWKKGALEWL